MKFLFILFFIFTFLGKIFFFLGWEIWYKIDQKRITEEKCINKDRPSLKCNGKCFLAKQLKRIENLESNKLPSKKSNPYTIKFEVQYSTRFSSIDYQYSINDVSNIHCFSYDEPISMVFLKSVFHPPAIG